MYKNLKHLLPAALLGLVTFTAVAERPVDCVTTKYFTRRSDSRHKPLQLVGDYRHTHLSSLPASSGWERKTNWAMVDVSALPLTATSATMTLFTLQ